ncbi:LysR family transcriptional regulator [Sandarakinorhabdus oryzae]|uniref:LysR family transcriptional regulator n=1 Tax=Sandarakinorhabdus oryzae TaxID=2675220 RepID=UPI0012E1FE75|nr:LysR family transcriptional regulator [Sandarakinorhabdus oryzae]
MLWQLNLRHLRAMAAITRLGSISAAAQAVSITQPAITQGLSKLETQLALTLFERQPGGMKATPAAELFAARVERALAHIGSPRVTTAQLRALLAIAEAGSYPNAARLTGLAQPTLHRALGDLAIALRRPLLERRGKGISFTDAGRRTIRQFRLARAELDAGLTELENLKGREVGRIVVGAMPLSRARVLPAAMAAFHARFPHARVAVSEGAFGELIEPLRDGEIDMMIGALRDPSPGPDIQQQALFTDQPAIFGRKGHPLAGTAPDLAALARYPWVVPAPSTPLYNQWRLMFESAGMALPDVPIECGSVIAIRQLLVATDFLTLLSPDQVAVELEAQWLVPVAETPARMSRTIGISTRTGWRPTALQAAFVQQLLQTVGKA